MGKLKAIPRFVTEIVFTAILFVVLWILWDFILKEYTVLSDQGLSTIGLALSTSVGVLTAIVVSFVLITWQSSRQERSASYWRWRKAFLELFDSFDTNLESLAEIAKDIVVLTTEASAAALIAPMPRDRLKELVPSTLNKVAAVLERLKSIKDPSKEDFRKGRAYKDIGIYLVDLATANLEHNISHYLYRRVLSLRGLLYRLLVVLIASILIVVIGVTNTSIGISNTLNTPLAAVLIAWVMYVLILLGREIRRISLLEEEFRRQEDIQFPRAVK